MSRSVWTAVVGYEGRYEVSNMGEVRGVERRISTLRGVWTVAGRQLKPWTDSCGYQAIKLALNGKSTRHSVHVLVLEAFVGPRPAGMVACHGNGVPADNRVANLRWDTQAANMADRIAHGTVPHRDDYAERCVNGHERTEANTAPGVRGGLTCRVCNAAAAKRSRAKKVTA